MQFRQPHPWDANYAIPDHVMVEPPLRGTHTGRGIPRRTVDDPAIAPPWRTGYAYPEYVGQEPIGQGAFRTAYTARKTVDTLVPEYLGDVEGFAESDPIAAFGEQMANYIMSTIGTLPKNQRKAALRAVFDQLDPKLWGRVAEKASKLQRAGVPDAAALREGIASAASMGLLEEFIQAGKTGRVAKKSMAGLALYGYEAQRAMLAGLGSWYNPLSWITAGTSKVLGATAPGAAKVGEWGKGVINQVGNLACKVAGSSLGQVAAGAGAAAAGAPPQVGAQGASLVSAACTKEQPVTYVAPTSSGPGWILPVALIGGAAVIALVILKGRK